MWSTPSAMQMRDLAFQHVFSRLFVYNILWEDNEVDEQSTVLGISGAGCRIAGHLSQHPRTIDAVDINARPRGAAPALRHPVVTALLRSPLQLVALGINFTQRDRLLDAERSGLGEHLVEHLRRVAATDLPRNWFAWTAIAGHYNHDLPDAVPPYLRRDRHARSFSAPTRVNFHRRDIFAVLAGAEPATWPHFTLCDAPDWMAAAAQRRLLAEIVRTGCDGGVVAYRSVGPDSLVARHGFSALEASSVAAARLDRSRQYQRVNYHRIVH